MKINNVSFKARISNKFFSDLYNLKQNIGAAQVCMFMYKYSEQKTPIEAASNILTLNGAKLSSVRLRSSFKQNPVLLIKYNIAKLTGLKNRHITSSIEIKPNMNLEKDIIKTTKDTECFVVHNALCNLAEKGEMGSGYAKLQKDLIKYNASEDLISYTKSQMPNFSPINERGKLNSKASLFKKITDCIKLIFLKISDK